MCVVCVWCVCVHVLCACVVCVWCGVCVWCAYVHVLCACVVCVWCGVCVMCVVCVWCVRVVCVCVFVWCLYLKYTVIVPMGMHVQEWMSVVDTFKDIAMFLYSQMGNCEIKLKHCSNCICSKILQPWCVVSRNSNMSM